jgi:ankyrin repeat protein
MRANVNRLTGLWLISFAALATGALAAGSDMRLLNAVKDQDHATVRKLVKEGVDVNAARLDGATPLLFAVHFNDAETVDLLLHAGAHVNAADDHGVTPLAEACVNANLTLVEQLLKAGADVNAAQTSGLTPLMIAAHTGNLGVVRALVNHRANVNAVTTETRDTALMWAIADRHDDIAEALIAARADVRFSSTKGFTPLMFAARSGDVEIARRLLAAGAGINETGSDHTHVLPFAIVSGQPDFALFLIEQGADPNGTIDGIPALHAAAGGVEIWLGDWNRRHDGGTAFGGGGRFGQGVKPAKRLELIKALVAHGAEINGRITNSAMLMSYIGWPKKGAFEPFACGTGDLRGATPLWVAAYTANGGVGGFGGDGGQQVDRVANVSTDGSTEIIKALLAAGADQRLTTVDGTTPLMVAAGLGRSTFSPGLQRGRRSMGAEEAVRVLLDAPGADINAVNEADFTALHGAAFRGLDEVIQILVDRRANINARDYRGRTPYRLAEGSKQSFQFQAYPETAEFIRKLGADTRLGIPGTVQERLRDVPVADQQQQ